MSVLHLVTDHFIGSLYSTLMLYKVRPVGGSSSCGRNMIILCMIITFPAVNTPAVAIHSPFCSSSCLFTVEVFNISLLKDILSVFPHQTFVLQ